MSNSSSNHCGYLITGAQCSFVLQMRISCKFQKMLCCYLWKSEKPTRLHLGIKLDGTHWCSHLIWIHQLHTTVTNTKFGSWLFAVYFSMPFIISNFFLSSLIIGLLFFFFSPPCPRIYKVNFSLASGFSWKDELIPTQILPLHRTETVWK